MAIAEEDRCRGQKQLLECISGDLKSDRWRDMIATVLTGKACSPAEILDLVKKSLGYEKTFVVIYPGDI